MPTTSNLDPTLQRKLEVMLEDPIEGPKLRAMINDTTGGTGQPLSVGNMLSKTAGAVSQQKTPSAQLGAGIGTLGGLALANLFKKKPSADPMAGRDSSSPGGQSIQDAVPPGEEPNGRYSGPGASSAPQDDSPVMMPEDMPVDDEDDNYRRGGGVKRKKKFAGGGDVAEEAPAPAAKRGVLTRRPVLSTTIVLTPKKAKAEKKKRGGRIKPRKPAAVPPLHGPGNGGPPAPFAKGGRVQVPRGSGCAQRGKQFRGIY